MLAWRPGAAPGLRLACAVCATLKNRPQWRRRALILGRILDKCRPAGAGEQEDAVHRRPLVNLRIFVAAIGAVSLAGVTLAGQATAPTAAKSWTPPRAADGHADL